MAYHYTKILYEYYFTLIYLILYNMSNIIQV